MAIFIFILAGEYFLKKKLNISKEDYGIVNKLHMYIRVAIVVVSILLIPVVENFILLFSGSASIYFLMETSVAWWHKREVKVWIIELFFSVICLSFFIINLVFVLK